MFQRNILLSLHLLFKVFQHGTITRTVVLIIVPCFRNTFFRLLEIPRCKILLWHKSVAPVYNHLLLSRGIRVRIPQKLDAVAFWSWNLDVVVFQSGNLDVVTFHPLKKCLGITMSWLSCLRFWVLWCFSPRISMSWFFGLGVLMSWFFGLEV